MKASWTRSWSSCPNPGCPLNPRPPSSSSSPTNAFIISKRRWILGGWALVVLGAVFDTHWWAFSRRETNTHIVREIGLFGYALYDLGTEGYRRWFDTIDRVDPLSYATFLTERRTRFPTPAPEDRVRQKNIVFLQLESMDAQTLDATLDGKALMPFFQSLRERSWVFENALDQTSVGRSSDCHVLVLTSQVPIQNQPIFTRYDLSNIRSLPRVLKAHGYTSFSMEGYQGEFWRWKTNHERLGIDRSYSITELDDSDMLGWGISDRSMVEQAVGFMRASEKPFFSHILMLTNHHPFEFVRESMGLQSQGIVSDYLFSARYVDSVIELLFRRLDEAGLLNDTIVAVYADHDSGITEELAQHLGREFRHGIEHERVPLMIFGLGAPRVVTRPVGLADLAPTVLTAVGIPVPTSFIGIPAQSPTGDVLLPNRMHVSRIDNGWAVAEAVELDLTTLTRLAIERPNALPE